jgi:GTP-binding protein
VEEPRATLRALEDRLTTSLTQVRGVPLITISAKSGKSVGKIMPAVIDVHDRWCTEISTSKLNRWLETAIDANPPPMVQNRRLKIRYMTQVAKRPPTFAFFANKPANAIPEHYKRYLVSGLRERFDLAGIVIRTIFKHGANPYDPRERDR